MKERVEKDKGNREIGKRERKRKTEKERIKRRKRRVKN